MGVAVVLGEMDVARAKPSWPGQPPNAQDNWFSPHRSATGTNFQGRGEGEGESRAAVYPVEEVHQARIA